MSKIIVVKYSLGEAARPNISFFDFDDTRNVVEFFETFLETLHIEDNLKEAVDVWIVPNDNVNFRVYSSAPMWIRN